MRIIFVRHGHPNYRNDCLTEIGHLQATAVAERLKNENIARICSSSCGRARETAEHIAVYHDLPVITYDFMREIGWGSLNGEPLFQNGHPWFTIDDMIAKGENLNDPDWANSQRFRNNEVTHHTRRVIDGFDEWLAALGYLREGNYYRVTKKNTENVIMTSHGGASCTAIGHLFSLPFPLATAIISANYTGITIVKMEGEEGDLILPRFEMMNDAKHIEGIEAVQYFGK